VDFKVPISHVRATWPSFLGGQWWVSWQAYTSLFRDVFELKLDGDQWDRDRAYAEAQSHTGWWWPYTEFVVVSDRPRVLGVETTAPWTYQLHCEDGPAVVWPDDTRVYSWHGTLVPRDLIEGNWTVERIFREPNTEIRRCAIEKMGWPEFIVKAGLKQVGKPKPDPGNPGFDLTLYDIPEQIFEQPVRVLLCANASLELDGTRRRFGLTVPAEIDDPVAAAAWTFGETVETYSGIEYAS
jgi:uncharacterized protein DUF6745